MKPAKTQKKKRKNLHNFNNFDINEKLNNDFKSILSAYPKVIKNNHNPNKHHKQKLEELVRNLKELYSSSTISTDFPELGTLTEYGIRKFIDFDDYFLNPEKYCSVVSSQRVKREMKSEAHLFAKENEFEPDIRKLSAKRKEELNKKLEDAIFTARSYYDRNGLTYELYKKLNLALNDTTKFKDHNNFILGRNLQVSSYNDVPKDLGEIIIAYEYLPRLLNKIVHPVEKAYRVHYTSLIVHPYADGNGRLMRVLMNAILTSPRNILRFPAIYLRNKDRKDYLSKLYGAQKAFLNRKREIMDNLEAKYAIFGFEDDGFLIESKKEPRLFPQYGDGWFMRSLNHNFLFLLGSYALAQDLDPESRNEIYTILQDHLEKNESDYMGMIRSMNDIKSLFDNTKNPENINKIKEIYKDYLLKVYYGLSEQEKEFAKFMNTKLKERMDIIVKY